MTPAGSDPDADADPGDVRVDDPIPTKEELAARSAGFRWPPTPYSPAADAAGSDRARGGAESLDLDPPLAATAGGPATPLSAWAVIEEVWLDLVAPPLTRRMAQLGWSPDPPGAYCHRCAATIGPHEATEAGCPICVSRRLPWSRIVRLGEYRPPLSLFVQEVKFTRWRRLGRELGGLLAASVAPALDAAGRDPGRVMVVPVPTTFRRRMARGIDHTRVLASGVARSLHAPLHQPLRRSHRPSQLDVPPSDRASNVSGAFRLRSGRVLAPVAAAGPAATILVIDDVTTTGATLRATCAAIRAAFWDVAPAARPHIWAAVLCWTPPAGSGRRGGPDHPTGSDRLEGMAAPWT